MSTPPAACYRVQLNHAFTFADAAAIAPYLAALGVSHLYCSPYLQAEPGSMHGYDIVDHHRLNAELGGDEGLAELAAALAANGLSQLVDIVPNHMAIDGPANRWWWDVLENGPASVYASYFDIDWAGRDERAGGTVLVPILGDHYGRILEAGELWVARRGGTFVVRYHDNELPLSPRTLDGILERAAQRVGSRELAGLAHGFGALPHAGRADAEGRLTRHREKERLTGLLAELVETEPPVGTAIDDELSELLTDTDALDDLLARQNFRLAHWRTARQELDFRRFFNIETLVGLRMEDVEVFTDTHVRILELVGAGVIDGLRIDHVDGLRDPYGYLVRLHDATQAAYVVVEKILAPGEALPAEWPVAGATGYEFLDRVNGLFVAAEHEATMTELYERFTGETAPYADVVHAAKRQITGSELGAELERLVGLLVRVTNGYRRQRDHTRRDLRDALRELLAAFPVYRTYVRPGVEPSAVEREVVAAALAAVRTRRPDIDGELVDFLGTLLLTPSPDPTEEEFAVVFQQLSAPVMAKGAEDTAFYRYHRLISLNEVGGDPSTFGHPVDRFHTEMTTAARSHPHALLTLSTHDTKRSADVRARINVLSELPAAWDDAVARWSAINEQHRTDDWPDRNAEYLLYQTIVGAWPLDAGRAAAFMAKASREAKAHTSWTDADPVYDTALERFTRAVISDVRFVDDLERFLTAERIVERGRANSLAQTALLLTCPGVPDIYQGTELWDLSLVDPDNRRPVDFEERRAALAGLGADRPAVSMADDERGVLKLWLVERLLAHRRRSPAAFDGGYAGLPAGDGVVAFVRPGLVVVAAVRTGRGDRGEVSVPAGDWTNILTGEALTAGATPVDRLLADLPVAVLAGPPG